MNKSDLTYDLLKSLADQMDCELIYWNDLDEVMSRNVTISRFIDSSCYISDKEYEILERKSWIGYN